MLFRSAAADLGFPLKVELVQSWAHHGEAGGWSTVWGLPKPVSPALVTGSTFLFRVPRGGGEDLAFKTLKRCLILEREGIGQRREEGFGWLKICTPFHLEREGKQ